MKHYLVTVDCSYKESLSPKAKIKRTRMRFLLSSSNLDNAMSQGEDAAEKYAPIGPKWLSFEAFSAASVQLPYLLTV